MSEDDEEERCTICLGKKRNPMTIQCGHSYCRKCLQKYKSYNKFAYTGRCPLCRACMTKPRAKRGRTNRLNISSALIHLAGEISTNGLANASLESMVTFRRNVRVTTTSETQDSNEEIAEPASRGEENSQHSDDDSDESEDTDGIETESTETDSSSDDEVERVIAQEVGYLSDDTIESEADEQGNGESDSEDDSYSFDSDIEEQYEEFSDGSDNQENDTE